MRTVAGIDGLRQLIGEEVGVSEWLAVDQSRIEAFGEATEDRQWIHLDPARAQVESPYRDTVAHGFLTLSLLSHLLSVTVSLQTNVSRIVNYGLNRVRFPAPVRSGTRIRARFRLLGIEDITGGADVCWLVTVETEGAVKPSLVAEWIVRYYF